MNAFDFTELKRKVATVNDFNAKKLCLYEALADYQQNVLYVNDFPIPKALFNFGDKFFIF